MLVKLFGVCAVIASGFFYSRLASRRAAEKFAESDRVLELFRYVKSEISDYGTPLDVIFAAKGMGGIEELLSEVSGELAELISAARSLGRGYGKEELRICDRLISCLEGYRSRCLEKLREEKAMAKVKGLGISAAIVILFI